MITRPALVLLACCSVTACAQNIAPNAPAVLTLEEAVNLSMANNREVKNAVLSAAIDEDQAAEATTYRFPSGNFYAIGSLARKTNSGF